jgi:hypothetical protein
MNVYISYALKDSAWARELASELQQAGHSPWFLEEYALLGDNFAREIGEALERSRAMVVLLSPEAEGSPLVRGEVSYALGSPNYANRLIPVVLRPTKGFPWVLKHLRPIRVGPDRAAAIRGVIDRLDEAPSPLLCPLPG